jgi:hypothetical protein
MDWRKWIGLDARRNDASERMEVDSVMEDQANRHVPWIFSFEPFGTLYESGGN